MLSLAVVYFIQCDEPMAASLGVQMDVRAINLLLQQIWRQHRLTLTYPGPHLELKSFQLSNLAT